MRERRKGCRAEREFAAYLRERGYDARRGCQYRGNPDAPDVVCDGPIHWEVKRTERFSLYPSLDQAAADCGDKVPAVAHRKNRREWVVVLRADDFFDLMEGE